MPVLEAAAADEAAALVAEAAKDEALEARDEAAEAAEEAAEAAEEAAEAAELAAAAELVGAAELAEPPQVGVGMLMGTLACWQSCMRTDCPFCWSAQGAWATQGAVLVMRSVTLHWQAKSVKPQPSLPATGVKQVRMLLGISVMETD